MNFIAHSSNRVSRHLVMEFLTWLLLRHREPRIVQVAASYYLASFPGSSPAFVAFVTKCWGGAWDRKRGYYYLHTP